MPGLISHFSFSPLEFARTPSKTPGVFVALLVPHWYHCCMQDFGCKSGDGAKLVVFSLCNILSCWLAGLFVMHWQCLPSFPEWFYNQEDFLSLSNSPHLKVVSIEFSRLYQILHCSSERAMSTFCPVHLDLAPMSVSCR